MYLDSECFDIVGAVGSSSEVRKIELDLVPAFVQSHGHGADKRLDPGSALVVRRSKSSAHIFIVQDLHFEGEVLLEVFDDHYEEREFDTEGLIGVSGSRYEGG